MYASTRMIFAALMSLSLTILWGRAFIQKLYALKIGHEMRVSDVAVLARQYQKSSDVPSMGGLLFISTTLFSAFLWMDFSYAFTYILILTALSMGSLGLLDDYLKIRGKKAKKGMRAKGKMISQVVFSIFLALFLLCPQVTDLFPVTPPSAKDKNVVLTTQEYARQYFIPFYKKPVVIGGFGIVLGFLLTLCVVVGSTNAVNLTDGLDGLATGLALLVAFILALVAFLSNNYQIASYLNILYIEGSGEIAIFLSALMGACFGFLWYNGYPAEVFMGDTGSLAIGGILGVSSVLLRREFLYALIGGVFVIEALSVILQVLSYRYRNKKRIFHVAPLHHHFQVEGWHEVKIVTRFWMIGLLLGLIGLISLKMQ